MSRLTDDPTDPDLCRGVDDEPVDQCAAYLVLSDEERAKGFVRPVRRTYVHQRGAGAAVPEGITDHSTVVATSPCGGRSTTMSTPLAETYARDPKFYGATYCVGCMMHRPVGEFDWDDGSVVGS